MRESKVVQVNWRDLILTKLWVEDEADSTKGSWVVHEYIEEEVWVTIANELKRRSIVIDKLEEALESLARDAVKVNNNNYLASRRFRVNAVEVEKALFVMRRESPVRKKKKK